MKPLEDSKQREDVFWVWFNDSFLAVQLKRENKGDQPEGTVITPGVADGLDYSGSECDKKWQVCVCRKDQDKWI